MSDRAPSPVIVVPTRREFAYQIPWQSGYSDLPGGFSAYCWACEWRYHSVDHGVALALADDHARQCLEVPSWFECIAQDAS